MTTSRIGGGMRKSRLEALGFETCLELLRKARVGRLAAVIEEYPVILPLNYRVVGSQPSAVWIALRTRPGNVIEQATKVAFEVDGFDPATAEGWSVLVRGALHHVDPDTKGFRERFDPEPWMLENREAWLVLEPFDITGRRLRAAERDWAPDHRDYER